MKDVKVIYLMDGTYTLDKQIRLTYVNNGLKIIGTGNTVITKGDTDWTNYTTSKCYSSIITLSGADNVTIEGIETKGAKHIITEKINDYAHGININTSKGVT